MTGTNRTSFHRWLRRSRIGAAALLWAIGFGAGSTPLAAQGSRGVSPPVPSAETRATSVYAFTCRNRPCADALPLLRPLLSSIGTVELQPGGNSLVIRDRVEAIESVVVALRNYDQPPQRLRIELLIVHADNASPAKPSERAAPKWVSEPLRNLLRWDYYSLLAQTALDVREGDAVTYDFGDGYRVTFQLGAISPDEKLRFNDFRVERRDPSTKPAPPASKQLLAANLNLLLGRPTTLGLAKSEQSQKALFLVLTTSRVIDPIVVPPPAKKPRGGGRR
ncbi:MAG: hypothetical protein SF066_20060 [Thermoanaerobaculia bacterium]|nr:hypothetical protein [Thermoanaerobaculia bacterium]